MLVASTIEWKCFVCKGICDCPICLMNAQKSKSKGRRIDKKSNEL